MTETIGLIGYGRFGKTLAACLAPHYRVKVYDPCLNTQQPLPDAITATPLDDVLKEKALIIAVPIRQFESVIQAIRTTIAPGSLVIDVCSVKVHPAHIMETLLPKNVSLLATHPLFGPDSIQSPSARKLITCTLRDLDGQATHWKNNFSALGFECIDMTPDEHDQMIAKTQGLTHFIGRLLEMVGTSPNALSTTGHIKLTEVMTYTCNDTWELFDDMQHFNPYMKNIYDEIVSCAHALKNRLDNLPHKKENG